MVFTASASGDDTHTFSVNATNSDAFQWGTLRLDSAQQLRLIDLGTSGGESVIKIANLVLADGESQFASLTGNDFLKIVYKQLSTIDENGDEMVIDADGGEYQPVPEPTTAALMLLAAPLMLGRRRRSKC